MSADQQGGQPGAARTGAEPYPVGAASPVNSGRPGVAPTTLAQLTTFRIGGPLPDLTVADTRARLRDFAAAHPLQPGSDTPPVLFVAGGSNIVAGDAGFAGPACLVRTSGIATREAGEGGVETLVTVEAGVVWDEFVAWALEQGLAGPEPLSGVPGTVGAAPVQNVGAYGAEVAELIETVTVYDRIAGQEHVLTAKQLEFSYRNSMLKREAARFGEPRFVVLAVTFRLSRTKQSEPIRYAQLAGELAVDVGARVDTVRLRRAVLRLRAGKGMVLDDGDCDTWSAGSFFTNPIVSLDTELPEGAPVYPVTDPLTGTPAAGVRKTSAAWLIDHAGFHKGFGVGQGRAALSEKHTLALTNRGHATAADVLELARVIRDGVRERFGITLVPEPNLVGCTIDGPAAGSTPG